MQNIYDMTTNEAAALIEEEIKSFINIECEQGRDASSARTCPAVAS
jgi:hypothetical protein